jgi:hypothetical protein
MRSRTDTSTGLKLQVVYSLGALARIGNVDPDLLRRILRANGVALVRVGRALSVPLSELRQKIPPLWESLLLCEKLRRSRGRVARQARGARQARLDLSGDRAS